MCDDNPPPESGEEYLDDPVLCVHCLEEVPWDANMCVHCKAPLNYIASTDPYQRVHAEGFILRTVAEKPRSWWAVIGIWVYMLSICGPLLSMSLIYWVLYRSIPWEVSGACVIAVPWLVVAVRSTANFFEWRRSGSSRISP